ncbi:MAG: sulfotransferase family 2 domain-containing protein [Pseudomonadota bacterium]
MNRLGHLAERAAHRLAWQCVPAKMIDRALPLDDPHLEAVYLKRGVILIHIPKNAGTSVEEAIYGYRVRHRTWSDIRRTCPTAWATLPKIAIVRDPVDRFLSAYDYLRAGGRNPADYAFARRLVAGKSAAEVAHQLAHRPRYRRVAMRYFHFRAQSDYVCDGTKAVVDHLIPIWDMAAGLHRYAGVPPEALRHENRTGGQRTSVSDLTPDDLANIETVYAADRALFDAVCDGWAAGDQAAETRRASGT